MNNRLYSFQFLSLLFLFLCSSCSTISKFDHYAYSQATSIKVDALSLMDSATQHYHLQQQAVTNVMISINKIYEYEKNRPKNTISAKMWAMIKDTSGNLYGAFIRRWRQDGRLDTVFIRESKLLIGQSFDQISQLESGKIKMIQPFNR